MSRRRQDFLLHMIPGWAIVCVPETRPGHRTGYPEKGETRKELSRAEVVSAGWGVDPNSLASSVFRSAVCGSIAPGESSRIPVLVEWKLISLSKKPLMCLFSFPRGN